MDVFKSGSQFQGAYVSNKFENLTFYEINPRAREEEFCCKLSKNMRDSV